MRDWPQPVIATIERGWRPAFRLFHPVQTECIQLLGVRFHSPPRGVGVSGVLTCPSDMRPQLYQPLIFVLSSVP